MTRFYWVTLPVLLGSATFVSFENAPSPTGLLQASVDTFQLTFVTASAEQSIGQLIDALEVVEEGPPLAHQQQEPPTRRVILGMRPQMLGQLGHPLAQQGHLNLTRTGVSRLTLVAGDQLLFSLGVEQAPSPKTQATL